MPLTHTTWIDRILIASFIIFGCLAMLFTAISSKEIIEGIASSSWHETSAQLISTSHSTADLDAEATYQYTVDGKTYQGHRIAYTGDQTVEDQLLADLKTGTSITIFYDHAHPNQSTIRRGIDTLLIFWVIFPLLIAIVLGSFAAGLIFAGANKDQLMEKSLDIFITLWLALFTILPFMGALLTAKRLMLTPNPYDGFYFILCAACTALFGWTLYRNIRLSKS